MLIHDTRMTNEILEFVKNDSFHLKFEPLEICGYLALLCSVGFIADFRSEYNVD